MLSLRQMDDRVSVHRDWFKDYKFHLIQSIEQFTKLIDICISKGLCSLDLESTGVDNRIYPDKYFDDGRETRHGIRTVDRIVGICMSFDGVNGYYIPLTHEPEDSGNLPWDPVWDEVTRLIEKTKIIFHNKKFDAEFLVPVTGRDYWKTSQFEDTFLVAKVISPLKSFPAGLKQLTKNFFNVDMVELDELFTDEKKEQLKRQKQRYNFALLHPKEGLEYGCSDGIFTYKLLHVLKPKIEGYEGIYDIEKGFCNVMREMERNRVHLDVERVNKLYVECQAAAREVGDLVRDMIEAKTGKTGKWRTLNVGSPSQLSEAMFTDQEGMKLKPTPEMTSDGQGGFQVDGDDSVSSDDDDDEDDDGKPKTYSLKDEVLKSLHKHYGSKLSVQRAGVVDKDGKPKPESLFELVLEYRHYDKMKGSYVEKFFQSHDRNGDVRPSFNQIGTDTTRLSSKAGKIEDGYSGVNFQGIPRDSDDDKPELFKQIRTVIIPRDGWMLLKIDYAGEELRVITNMSGDPIWKDSFLNKDGDVHSITARILFGKDDITKDQRGRGKRSNFAIIYGGGAGAISRNVGCSIEDGGRHIENMRTGIPVLMGYVDHQKKFAHKHKCIYTAFGRRIPIPTIDSPIKAIQRKAERCAINYTIQATSADILKLAMCFVDKQLRSLGWKDRVRYVLTVHDEVVFEVKPQYLMEVTRRLDEWMVLPWRLPKAHGIPWTVPLETEPGIDIHWRARFDYFAMVDGKPVAKGEVAEDGTYKGKLKGDQYFADGRVYQKIPDFLQDFIWRLTPEQSNTIKTAQAEGVSWEHPIRNAILPAPAPVPELLSGFSEPPDHTELMESARELTAVAADILFASLREGGLEPAHEALFEKTPEPIKTEASMDIGDIDFDVGIAGPEKEVMDGVDELSLDDVPDIDVALDDVTVDVTPPSSKPVPPKQPPTVPSAESFSMTKDDGRVLRWMLTAIPSVAVARKLRAICILAEGEMPLRVVNPKGEVLIREDQGLAVDPPQFQFLTKLFGLQH